MITCPKLDSLCPELESSISVLLFSMLQAVSVTELVSFACFRWAELESDLRRPVALGPPSGMSAPHVSMF